MQEEAFWHFDPNCRGHIVSGKNPSARLLVQSIGCKNVPRFALDLGICVEGATMRIGSSLPIGFELSDSKK